MQEINVTDIHWDKNKDESCLIECNEIITLNELANCIGIENFPNAIVRRIYIGGGISKYALMDWLKVNGMINELIGMEEFWVQVKKEFNESTNVMLCSSQLFQCLWTKDIVKCRIGGYNITQSETCELVRIKANEYIEASNYARLFYASNSKTLFKQVKPYDYELYSNFSNTNKELRNGFLDFVIERTK